MAHGMRSILVVAGDVRPDMANLFHRLTAKVDEQNCIRD
jgi:hypothetical protein